MDFHKSFNGVAEASDEDSYVTTKGQKETYFYKSRGYPEKYLVRKLLFNVASQEKPIMISLTKAEYPEEKDAIRRALQILGYRGIASKGMISSIIVEHTAYEPE